MMISDSDYDKKVASGTAYNVDLSGEYIMKKIYEKKDISVTSTKHLYIL